MTNLNRQSARGCPVSSDIFGPLVTPEDALDYGGKDAGRYDADAWSSLAAVSRYMMQVLTADHPQLGRPGAVCPFIPMADRRGLLFLTASSMAWEDADSLIAGMTDLSRWIKALDQAAAMPPFERHRAVVVVFPRLSPATGAALIDRVQQALKLDCIEQRLMIGEFYPDCPKPGLWNADFRPLQAPVISLAIRNMTIFDASFMLEKQVYIDAFVRIYGDEGLARIQELRMVGRCTPAGRAEPIGRCPGA